MLRAFRQSSRLIAILLAIFMHINSFSRKGVRLFQTHETMQRGSIIRKNDYRRASTGGGAVDRGGDPLYKQHHHIRAKYLLHFLVYTHDVISMSTFQFTGISPPAR